jgi:hypothetical protein
MQGVCIVILLVRASSEMVLRYRCSLYFPIRYLFIGLTRLRSTKLISHA